MSAGSHHQVVVECFEPESVVGRRTLRVEGVQGHPVLQVYQRQCGPLVCYPQATVIVQFCVVGLHFHPVDGANFLLQRKLAVVDGYVVVETDDQAAFGVLCRAYVARCQRRKRHRRILHVYRCVGPDGGRFRYYPSGSIHIQCRHRLSGQQRGLVVRPTRGYIEKRTRFRSIEYAVVGGSHNQAVGKGYVVDV